MPKDDDDAEAQLDHVIVSVSFMDGSAASFVFAQQPEEHELRSRGYDEFALSEDCVDVVFTQGSHVLEPLAFVDPGGPVCAVKRSVDAGKDCVVGSALPCGLAPCCPRHRGFRLFQRGASSTVCAPRLFVWTARLRLEGVVGRFEALPAIQRPAPVTFQMHVRLA